MSKQRLRYRRAPTSEPHGGRSFGTPQSCTEPHLWNSTELHGGRSFGTLRSPTADEVTVKARASSQLLTPTGSDL